MTRDKLIQFAREEHQRKVKERVDDPEGDVLGSILLFSPDDSIQYVSLLLEKNERLTEFLRDLRRMLDLKIAEEGLVAGIHTSDMFFAKVDSPERLADIRRLAKTDSSYLETAQKRGWVVNREAIQTIAESASTTLRIVSTYRRERGRVVVDSATEFLDEPVPRTYFHGFAWKNHAAGQA